MNKQTDGLIIYTHQGMGDQIECNGLVRDICKNGIRGVKYNHVEIVVKETHTDTVEFMYRDEPKIKKVHIIPDDVSWDYAREYAWVTGMAEDQGTDICMVGHREYFDNIPHFQKNQQVAGQAFYALVELPWSDRIDKFHVERDYEQEQRVFEKLNPDNEKYIFVHDGIDKGFALAPHLMPTEFKVIKNDPTENIFYMLKILENAEEIHCMSSSYLCLIDSFHKVINFKNLVYHWYVRKVLLTPDYLFANWKWV